MSLLSEDEEWNLWNAQGIDDMNQAEAIAFARAYAAAILAKLASAELLPVQDLSDEEKQFIHYNPNTDDLVDFIQGHAVAYGRQAHAQGFAAGAASQLAEKPSGYLSQYNLEMLRQGYPQTIVMLEGAKRDTPLYTRREA